jgi:hypothetical protein
MLKTIQRHLRGNLKCIILQKLKFQKFGTKNGAKLPKIGLTYPTVPEYPKSHLKPTRRTPAAPGNIISLFVAETGLRPFRRPVPFLDSVDAVSFFSASFPAVSFCSLISRSICR